MDDTPLAAADHFLQSLRKPAHVLVAVSGGSDSTGLLIALAARLKTLPSSDITLSAATVDHGLRAESAGEADAVAALCDSLQIPHVLCRWQGDKPKTGLMAAAREARYGLLADAALQLNADVIVTAHTRDDQQETLAMRAARGSGSLEVPSTGIADAVLFDRRVWIMRPFLGCSRADIRAYLTSRSVAWIDDPSNDDPHYERVRVRQQLGVQAQRPVMSADAAAVRLSLSDAGAAWVAAYVEIHAAALCAIRREGLGADRVLLAYVLSHLAAVFGGQVYGPGTAALGRILDFLKDGVPGRRTAAGVVFDLRRDGLYLGRESRGIEPLVVPPKSEAVWDGRFLVANGGDEPVLVAAAGEQGRAFLPEGLPKSAVQRARAAAPLVSALASGSTEIARHVAITPRLQPFDRFLTRFDLTLANGLAASFGRNPYLPLPL